MSSPTCSQLSILFKDKNFLQIGSVRILQISPYTTEKKYTFSHIKIRNTFKAWIAETPVRNQIHRKLMSFFSMGGVMRKLENPTHTCSCC